MKKIIIVILIILTLIGCSKNDELNKINNFVDKGITFSLPNNYYLDSENMTIIHFENEKLEVIGTVQYKDFDDAEVFNSFFKMFTIEFKKEYLEDIDAYKGIDTIGSNRYESYSFYNKERLNFFKIDFIDQNDDLINSIIKTVNNNVEIENNDKETIDYSFSNKWNKHDFDSFEMALPSNVYISNKIDNQIDLYVKNNNDFIRIAILYLDEFTNNEFDHHKNVSPSGSRTKLTDNIYKDIGTYSLINHDLKTISTICFTVEIDSDFEKQFVDSIKFKK